MSTAETDVRTFTLPDIGEGLVEARVVHIFVAEGQAVARFDVVMEVETDKAVVELNSPWTGTIHKLHPAVDDYVQVGEPILEIAVAPAGG